MDDNRREALHHAVNFGAAANLSDRQIVEAALTFHRFLIGVDGQPPPLPAVHPIVEQVRHDASQLGPESLSSAPLGFRGEMPDLSQADQSPKWGPITGEYPLMSFDDDTKTRIISRAREAQLSEK